MASSWSAGLGYQHRSLPDRPALSESPRSAGGGQSEAAASADAFLVAGLRVGAAAFLRAARLAVALLTADLRLDRCGPAATTPSGGPGITVLNYNS